MIGRDAAGRVVHVVVVDDHPVFRLGMVSLLGSLDGITVAGQAASATEAAGVLDAGTTPDLDVVLMDVDLGDGTGIEVTRELVRRRPEVAVLVVTMHEDDDNLVAAIRAGARGYLLKSASPTEVERAVRAVANGEVILGPEVAARTLAYLSGARTAAVGGPVPFPELTAREREVLDLVARGLDNASVARRLVLADKTVRNTVAAITAKLGVRDRSALIVRAREGGLGA
ncbi:response regulator [Aquipuribacter nitratireducens]|uniref:Response regulator n=1 Tax=Aquipuribacter nitratireducens TaxID=650104 RepID=A0ABW0GMG9_9MICO